MRLIFRTPSRSCPLRHFNGSEVTVEEVVHGLPLLRRRRRYTPAYFVVFPDGAAGHVYQDELFLEPSEAPCTTT